MTEIAATYCIKITSAINLHNFGYSAISFVHPLTHAKRVKIARCIVSKNVFSEPSKYFDKNLFITVHCEMQIDRFGRLQWMEWRFPISNHNFIFVLCLLKMNWMMEWGRRRRIKQSGTEHCRTTADVAIPDHRGGWCGWPGEKWISFLCLVSPQERWKFMKKLYCGSDNKPQWPLSFSVSNSNRRRSAQPFKVTTWQYYLFLPPCDHLVVEPKPKARVSSVINRQRWTRITFCT